MPRAGARGGGVPRAGPASGGFARRPGRGNLRPGRVRVVRGDRAGHGVRARTEVLLVASRRRVFAKGCRLARLKPPAGAIDLSFGSVAELGDKERLRPVTLPAASGPSRASTPRWPERAGAGWLRPSRSQATGSSSSTDSDFNRASLMVWTPPFSTGIEVPKWKCCQPLLRGSVTMKSVGEPIGRVKRPFSVATGCSARLLRHFRAGTDARVAARGPAGRGGLRQAGSRPVDECCGAPLARSEWLLPGSACGCSGSIAAIHRDQAAGGHRLRPDVICRACPSRPRSR